MAQFRYDAPLGADKTDVTANVGSNIGTSAVRVVIDTVNAPTKVEVLKALEAIEQVIIQGKWPPA